MKKRIIILLIVALFVLGVLCVKCIFDDEEKLFPTLSDIKSDSDKALEEIIEYMLINGAIQSINLESGQIRVSYANWNRLDVEEKRTVVTTIFSNYIQLKTGKRSVLVLGENSSRVLARYDPETMNDIAIYE